MMKKQDALDFLEAHKHIIIDRFGVKHLALFGSVVRDEARADSDLDILVEFEGGENYRNYFDLLFYLEDNLHCTIDLVSHDALRPQLKPYIEKEAFYVA
jgi:predicted nucleotidyltransferase